jgi:TonB family protein
MRVGAQLLLTFLLNASWQIALVVAFASACDWLLRETAARYRHALWIAALGLALVLPLWSPVRAISARLVAKTEPPQAAAKPVFVTSVYSPELDTPEARATNHPASPATETAPQNFFTSGIHLSKPPAILLVGLYGLFVLLRAGQLFRAWRRTTLIVRTAFACEFSGQVRKIIEECQAATTVRRVRLLCSHSVPVPSTVGVLSPLIILPAGLLDDVDEEVLTSAVGHELVHVARRDYLANLICEFIYLPLSFHPGAALLRRRIRQTRELCCDESVAGKLMQAEVYARSLVRLIGAAPLERRLAVDTTIGISESDILEVRIMSLLKRSGLTARRKRLLLITAALLLAVPCVAATSFALSLDIDRENLAFERQAQEKQSQEKTERQDQERWREELKRTAKELKAKARMVPESQRAEIEARLVEVQRNLEFHERLLEQSNQTREGGQKKLEAMRAMVTELEKNPPANEARLKEAREQIAAMERFYSEARTREEDENLTGLKMNRKARVIHRVEPKYTDDARANKISGSVVLGLTVDQQGLPQNIQVKKSLYPSLDESAIEAARQMRFEPAIKDGQPVSMFITVEMNFMMEQGKFDAEQARLDRMKQEKAEREGSEPLELRRKRSLEGRSQEERAKAQAALTRDATLSMDRAIQIAISQVPGKVLACSLGRDGVKVFYHVVIITADGDKSIATYVWVSATDGQILKTEKEERKEETSMAREPVGPISGGVLNGKASSLPAPVYPAIARAAHASGSVTVEVLVDEAGNVVAAHAVSGHPLLQAAAVAAARQASFSPTKLSGEPVKVSGALVYNFVAQ